MATMQLPPSNSKLKLALAPPSLNEKFAKPEFEISENKAFELPDIFMNLIGKYSSSLSFPGKPSLD